MTYLKITWYLWVLRTTTNYLVSAVGVCPYSTQTLPSASQNHYCINQVSPRQETGTQSPRLSFSADLITNLKLSHQQRRNTWRVLHDVLKLRVLAEVSSEWRVWGAPCCRWCQRCTGRPHTIVRGALVAISAHSEVVPWRHITVVSAIPSSHLCHSLTVRVLHDGRRHVSTLPVTVTQRYLKFHLAEDIPTVLWRDLNQVTVEWPDTSHKYWMKHHK